MTNPPVLDGANARIGDEDGDLYHFASIFVEQ